jgi:FimV-like protein
MLRKTAVILSILLASMATQVSGLGLGTISVDSTLNQPLRVRIEVLKLGGTRLDDQRISASVRQPISPILQAPSRTVAQPFVQPMADDIRPPIATPVSPPLQLVEVSSPREPTAEVEETDTDLIDVAETPEAKTTVVKTINTTVTETVSDIAPQVRPGVTIPEQLDVPQGRLSVVSGNDDVAATDTESSMLIEEENAELDQRIAELEIQLAVQQEEADRAAVERGNLNSRLAVVEAQIVAAEEIIRLQDLQLAALQEGLAQAAEIAAAEAVLQAEIAAPVAPATSLMGNTLLLGFGVVLVILILVVLLLRRNRAAELEDDEFDELAGDEFEVAIEVDEAETVAEQAEDGDSADIDEDAADEAVEEASPLPTDEDALGDAESFEADDMALSFDPGGDEAEAESSQSGDGPDADEKDEGGEETNNEAETLEADIEEFDADVEEQEEEAEEAAIDDQEITDDAIEIEFDLGEGVAAKADQQEEISADAASASEQETEDLDDDLGFVDNDEMEIEFVDDIEEVQLLPGDESATKLELAYAYQKMGDVEGAKEILLEVIEEGTEEQVTEAGKLLLSLDKLSD